MTKPKIMLIGLGSLGLHILDHLVRAEELGRIFGCDIDVVRGTASCNLARLSALAQGFHPKISFIPIDLKNKDSVTDIVSEERPDMIIHAATLMTWWLTDLLPEKEQMVFNQARFGVWLPVHLTLTLKLMEALRDTDFQGPVLTAPFPDVVNCVLGRIGLAPTCGVGNLAEIVPKLEHLAAEKMGVSPAEIDIFLVAHHALESFIYGKIGEEIPPYFLRIFHQDKDITEDIEAPRLLLSSYRLPPGTAIHFLTAAATLRLIRGFFSDKDEIIHVPAPNGLPGGYPVIVNREEIKLAPIPGLAQKKAVEINELSHPYDGIERIEDDGTVIFCERDAEAMRTVLGYDCRKLNPDESEERAKELIARFREYAQRHGVRLPN